MKNRIVFSLLFFVLMSIVINADDIKAQSYNLNDIWKLALKNNDSIKIAAGMKDVASANVTKAWGELLPKINVNFLGNYYDRSVALDFGGEKFEIFPRISYTATGTITQPIFTGGRIINGINIANAFSDITDATEQMINENIYFGIAALYYQIAMFDKEVQILSRSIELSQKELSKAKLRFDVGEVTKPAVLLAEITLKDTERKLMQQKSALDVARFNLATLVGIKPDFILDEPITVEEPIGTEAELIQRALAKRQDIQQTLLSRKIADYQKNIAWGGLFPVVAIQAQYLNQSSVFPANSYASIGVIVSFPVFDGGVTYGAISEARAKATIAELEIRNLQNKITIEVSEAYSNLQTVKITLDMLEKQVSVAEEYYTLSSTLYEVGDATALELAQALIAYDQAKITYSNIKYQKNLATLNLKRAIGELLKNE